MSWLDEPTTELPTAEEIRLLQIEQAKQILREAKTFAEQSARLRQLSIETAFGVHVDIETGTIRDVQPTTETANDAGAEN